MRPRTEPIVLSTYFLPYIFVPFAVSYLVSLAAKAYWDESLAPEFFREVSSFLLILAAFKAPAAAYFLMASFREFRSKGLRAALLKAFFSISAIILVAVELHASLMAAEISSSGDPGAFVRLIGDIGAIELLILAVAASVIPLVAKLSGKLSLVFTVIAAFEALMVASWLDSMSAAVVPWYKTQWHYLQHFILVTFFSFSAENPADRVSTMLRAFSNYSAGMVATGVYLVISAFQKAEEK